MADNPYGIVNSDIEKLMGWSKTGTVDFVQQMNALAQANTQERANAAAATGTTKSSGSPSSNNSSGSIGAWSWNPNSGPVSSDQLTTIKTRSGNVTVNKQAVKDFQGFLNALYDKGYKTKSLGGYNPRKMRSNSNAWSSHAGGYAIDINPATNPVTRNGKVVTDMPSWVQSLAKKYNLFWGGAWKGPTYDPMHFSWKVAR